MEKVRYSIDWRILLLTVGGFAIMLLITNVASPANYPQVLEVNLILIATMVFFGANYTIGTYGLLDKKTGILSRTDYLFYTQRLNVKDIKIIYYRPTWIVGGLTRSLYVVDDEEKVIEFPNVGWYEPMLAKMINDLMSINPSIQLDEHAKSLVKKYRDSRSQ